jgi:hypothetical protein
MLAPLASAARSVSLASAPASVLDTAMRSAASQTVLYGVFHARAMDSVFVKPSQRRAFAGPDTHHSHHEGFRDAATGFVFLEMSGGWKFLGPAAT